MERLLSILLIMFFAQPIDAREKSFSLKNADICAVKPSPSSFVNNSVGLVECVNDAKLCNIHELNLHIPMRNEPKKDAKIYGHLTTNNKTKGSAAKAIFPQSEKGAETHTQDVFLAETDYEFYALPIHEVSDDRQWMRIVNKWMLSADLGVGDKARYVDWSVKIQETHKDYVYSLVRSVKLYEDNALSDAVTTLSPDDGWDIEIIDVDGDWAQVRLLHYCRDDATSEHSGLWMRLKSDYKTINLLPYARGC